MSTVYGICLGRKAAAYLEILIVLIAIMFLKYQGKYLLTVKGSA